jgi:hypothetical protein
VPTLSGDILAFSNLSIWNTTARVTDFQKISNFGNNFITGKSERVGFEIDLSTGVIILSTQNEEEEKQRVEPIPHSPNSEYLSLLIHKYASVDKATKDPLWKVKHSEIVDTVPSTKYDDFTFLTRGNVLSVVAK